MCVSGPVSQELKVKEIYSLKSLAEKEKRLSTKRTSQQLKSQHGQSKNRYAVAVCSLYLHFVHIFFVLENIVRVPNRWTHPRKKNNQRIPMMRVSEWEKQSREIKMTLSKANEWCAVCARYLIEKCPHFSHIHMKFIFFSLAPASHRF